MALVPNIGTMSLNLNWDQLRMPAKQNTKDQLPRLAVNS
jgi:hypothetical protein